MENEQTKTIEDEKRNLVKNRSWKKYLLFLLGGGLLIMLIISLTPEASAPMGNYTINGSRVYVDNDRFYLSVEPHTIYRNGDININLTSKVYDGRIDVYFGFDRDIMKPNGIKIFRPHLEEIESSFSCNSPYWFNFTLNPRHFWCWGNATYYNEIFVFNNENSFYNNYFVYEPLYNFTKLIFEHDFDRANLSLNTAYWRNYVLYDSFPNKTALRINVESKGIIEN